MSAGSHTIEVRISRISQLFNSLDPSPFRSRDLDPDAEEHIVGWAQELPMGEPIEIAVHLPRTQLGHAQEMELEQSILNYFQERTRKYERDLREHFLNGWRYLAIGLPLLCICLLSSQLAASALGHGAIARVVEESLIIVGWVANWKPIETFLYGWWPILRTRNLFRQLSCAEVRIIADHPPDAGGVVPTP
ncbi:MAG: hypothetical protein APF80_00990 [Alphaproteobacteria bacterium BRH_c36]|nr:MAG: hypothetical protein APF80_00990 [Alphaproteobacteria bacterium BRH_c36]